FFSYPGHAGVIAIGRRLFSECQATILQFANAGDGGIRIPTAVGIDHQGTFRPNRFAYRAHACDVRRRVSADLNFKRVKAHAGQLLRSLTGSLWRVGSNGEATTHFE